MLVPLLHPECAPTDAMGTLCILIKASVSIHLSVWSAGVTAACWQVNMQIMSHSGVA